MVISNMGPNIAAAFTLADSHNPDNMVPVSTGDLVGGSPYESAIEQDKPTLDMAGVGADGFCRGQP